MFKDYTLMLEAFTVSEQTDFDDPVVIEVEAVLYHIFKREQEENPYVEMGVLSQFSAPRDLGVM